MKDKLFLIAIFAMFLTVLPFLASAAGQGEAPLPDGSSSDFREQGEGNDPIYEGDRTESGDILFHVFNVSTGQAMSLPGKEYITHVVAAEMPASFHEEALKAQAVAAFTYALHRREAPPDATHEGCELCTDSTHCKAYADDAYLRSLWGKDYDYYYERIAEAVEDVYGTYIMYRDKPIAAVFHALSAGVTEDAANVWGHKYPYLVSVDSAWDKQVSGYETKVTVSKKEFKNIMKSYSDRCEFPKDPENWIKNITRSEAGGVLTAEIGGVTLAGSRIRGLFDLRSANFTVQYDDGNFVFTVKGYGHGVGMSQYGANLMAKGGATYKEILLHYYTGVSLESKNPEELP